VFHNETRLKRAVLQTLQALLAKAFVFDNK
jgi:hypothetical protein